mgnify:CR=1 FL=1
MFESFTVESRRVLVCGGRDYADIDRMYQILDSIAIDDIISGHARGADQLAEVYAEGRDINVTIFPAEWNKHGRAAGFIRNKQMLDEGQPDLVVAFPGGRGTANMVDLAKKAGVSVLEVSGG